MARRRRRTLGNTSRSIESPTSPRPRPRPTSTISLRTGLMPDTEAVSASSIQLYLTCSLKWRFQYHDRLPRPTISANQAFGTTLHAALNWLHKERKLGHHPPLADLIQVFEADWYAQTQTENRQPITFD